MPPGIQEYFKLFPTILFLCDDDIHSMHFVLSLKHMPEDQQKQLVELMNHCGAKISFNLEDATGHSVIIVDHEEIVHFKAPAFTINYIESCLDKLKLQDISDFRQYVTKHIAQDVKCMDVVYFRSQCWNSVLSEAEKTWFEEHIISNISVDWCQPQASSSHVDILGLIKSRFETDKHSCNSHPKGKPDKTNNEHLLSSDEDSDVEEINGHTSSNEVYQGACDIQKNSTIGNQDAENLKTTKDNKNLQSKFINSKSKVSAALNSNNKSMNRRQRGETNSTSTVPSSTKWTFLNDFQSGSSDEEVAPEVAEEKKEKNFFDFEVAKDNVFHPTKDKKHSRMPYSYDEQSKILKYIVEHNEFSRIKGRELWMIMERRKICPNRTWQSMKEHFVKKIMYILESFDFITDTHKFKLKNVF